MIDSLGDFIFRDRLTATCAGEGSTLSLHAVRTLSRLLHERAVVIVAAKPMLFSPRDGSAFDHREYLPSVWQSLVTLRLNLTQSLASQSHQLKRPRFDMWLRFVFAAFHHGNLTSSM